MSKIGKWLLLIAGIFAVFAGFNMLAHPATTLASMTFLFALVFAVQGISEIVQYFKSEEKAWLEFIWRNCYPHPRSYLVLR